MPEQFELHKVEARLVLRETPALYSSTALDSPDAAVDIMSAALRDMDREYACVVNLDNKMRPINFNIVSIGSINVSMVPVANVFKTAILQNASALMMIHNHPSGDVTPSREDHEVTKRIIEVGKLMDIPVIDHVIIGPDGRMNNKRFSFRTEYSDMFKGAADLDYIGKNIAESKATRQRKSKHRGDREER